MRTGIWGWPARSDNDFEFQHKNLVILRISFIMINKKGKNGVFSRMIETTEERENTECHPKTEQKY